MKVKVNGVEIYYQKLGKGHPLILLHGHHQDGGIFDKLVAPLSLYYTVVVPDMRGHGLSVKEKQANIIKLKWKIYGLLLARLNLKSLIS